MADSFFFYDLETSGFSPREARIMQFAGQRTDMDLKPVGEPYNFLIKLSEDVLPDPDAVLVTSLTPQATIADGITETEFLKIFHKEITLPGTIFTGFNTVRFDDEFMRFLHYRNFYDAYEWQWQDSRSRWDILDVVRMTRALRPEGIKWPYDSAGKPSCKLTLLTASNGLDHANAHNALNDVLATVALARLLKEKQPKLFNYLLEMRDKKKIKALADSGRPFVYTSGKYSGEHEKTTVVAAIADHPKREGKLVYDLRHDPTPFLKMTSQELAEAWRYNKDKTVQRLPVKTLQFNRCPAIAPLDALLKEPEERLDLSRKRLQANLEKLRHANGFVDKVLEALMLLEQHQQATFLANETEVDAQLYDDFFSDADRREMGRVRAAGDSLKGTQFDFRDSRLKALLPLYKARNFPRTLSEEEQATWEKFRQRKLLGGKAASRMTRYFERIAQLSLEPRLSDKDRYLLEELQLYGQAILPAEY